MTRPPKKHDVKVGDDSDSDDEVVDQGVAEAAAAASASAASLSPHISSPQVGEIVQVVEPVTSVSLLAEVLGFECLCQDVNVCFCGLPYFARSALERA